MRFLSQMVFFKAVDDLSLSVPTGTVFGLLGANGAGKTTTIHLLLGLLEPTSGTAHVLGFDTRKQAASIRVRTGSLLESNGLYERMTAQDNLAFYGLIYHMPRQQREARIKELLTHLDLWDRRYDRPATWSRGMKQKLALARVLLHRPALVFLDEPTAGLDPLAATTLNKDLMRLVKQEGMTVFLNTHNLADAEKYCDQVGVIRDGSLLAVGNPDVLRLKLGGSQVEILGSGFHEQLVQRLRQQPGILEVAVYANRLVIRLNDTREVAPLISLIVREGGIVEEVLREHGSLAEVFLSLLEENTAC
ncbi:MAG TPA: ABC transporter ATP-binding protein [Ktedonobacteraceae bacterium]